MVHNNVWAKMIANGVTGRILKVIQSMYRQLKNQARDFQGNLSDPFEGVIGLRQGESLSPLLFALIVNDIESELRRGQGDRSLRWEHVVMSLLMYADDLCVLADSESPLFEMAHRKRRLQCSADKPGRQQWPSDRGFTSMSSVQLINTDFSTNW